MMSNKNFQLLLIVLSVGLLSACGSSLAIQNVDFSQPIETVMEADNQGNVEDFRNGISFNLSTILENENIALASFSGTDVHLIRDQVGYYFLTASGFRHVYVLESGENKLKSVNKIRIEGDRISTPALNQRNSHIELVDGSRIFRLTKDGIRN